MKLRFRSYFAVLVSIFLLYQPVSANEIITYSYDALGRLTGVTVSGNAPSNGQTVSTSHDAAANRTIYAVTGSGGAAARAAEPANITAIASDGTIFLNSTTQQ